MKTFNLFLIISLLVMGACAGNNEQTANAETTKDSLTVNTSELQAAIPFASVTRQPKNTYSKDSIAIDAYDFENFEPFLHAEDGFTYVINFWATWCIPCVKELPAFEQLRENYAGQNVHVLLVSIDFAKAVETSLLPFLQKEQLKSEVILLDDADANSWIEKVDPSWSGAIPATVIYNKSKRAFFERSFTYEELETELKKFL